MNYKTYEEAHEVTSNPNSLGCLRYPIGTKCKNCNKFSYAVDEDWCDDKPETICPWCHPKKGHCWHKTEKDFNGNRYTKRHGLTYVKCCYCGHHIGTSGSDYKKTLKGKCRDRYMMRQL